MWRFSDYNDVGLKSTISYTPLTLDPQGLHWISDYPVVCDTMNYFYDITSQNCKRISADLYIFLNSKIFQY